MADRTEEGKCMKCVTGRPDMLLFYIARTQTAQWLVLLLAVGSVISQSACLAADWVTSTWVVVSGGGGVMLLQQNSSNRNVAIHANL